MSIVTKRITEVLPTSNIRIHTGLTGFDKVVGGGLMLKSCILFAGQPGVGKSTLWLQISKLLASKGYTILYVTGEEDLSQLRARADRMNAVDDNIIVSNSTVLEDIVELIKEHSPRLLIVDSLQTIYSRDVKSRMGTSRQLEHCLSELITTVKNREMIFVTIGHSTKSNVIAGLLRLQHAVDTTLFMTNEYDDVRCLRVVKNRFGRSNIGWFCKMLPAGFSDLDKKVFSLDAQIEQSNSLKLNVFTFPIYAIFYLVAIMALSPILFPVYLFKKVK